LSLSQVKIAQLVISGCNTVIVFCRGIKLERSLQLPKRLIGFPSLEQAPSLMQSSACLIYLLDH
jgi:hypothetical protein